MPMTLHVDLSLCLSPCRMCLLSLPSVSQYMGGGGRRLLESTFLRLVTSKSGGSKKAVGRRQKDKAVVGTKKKVSTPHLQHIRTCIFCSVSNASGGGQAWNRSLCSTLLLDEQESECKGGLCTGSSRTGS